MLRRVKLLLITQLVISSIGFTAQAKVLPGAETETPQYKISREELFKKRPANGFRLVQSENDAVCQPFLQAINEEGYNSNYFNRSAEFETSLSELLIQTRLNIPRTLIGTHVYRTEEYVLQTGQGIEYWYRIAGAGPLGDNYLVLLAKMDSESEPWTKKYAGQRYTDFLDFLDNINPQFSRYHSDRYSDSHISLRIKSSLIEYRLKTDNRPRDISDEFFLGWDADLVMELVAINNGNYIALIGSVVKEEQQIKILLTDFNSKNICYIQSIFTVND